MTDRPLYPAGVARQMVFRRDGYQCVAPLLDPSAGPCFGKFGEPFSGYDPTGFILEADRVNAEPGSRAASHEDPRTMVTECPGHHRGTGPNHGRVWATSHRDLLRDYLRQKNAPPDSPF